MKIALKRPIAELDGDEMTRVIWALIKERLILPHLDLELERYDLGLPERDRTADAVTLEAARAIARLGVGVKCATITPDAARVEEYALARAWPSPNATIRAFLDGTVFRSPILARGLRPALRSWVKPIAIGRHAYGDLYRAVDLAVPGPGLVELVYTPRGSGGEPRRLAVHDFDGPGVAMGMHNLDASIASFASACFSYALSERVDIWFAAKDTISKIYHARFRELFAAEAEARSGAMRDAGISYRYLLIDDAVAQIVKHPGGILWACTNYDGDVMSDMVAAGFGSLGMMRSVLVSPSGAFEYEAAHGTVMRHYREHLAGRATSTNPTASIYAWTGAIRKRGELDGTPEAVLFAELLERSVLDAIESGTMTKDLLPLAEPAPAAAAGTQEFIDAVAGRLESALARRL